MSFAPQLFVPFLSVKHHLLPENAGHFIQEDCAEEIANTILEFIKENPVPLNTGATVVVATTGSKM